MRRHYNLFVSLLPVVTAVMIAAVGTLRAETPPPQDREAAPQSSEDLEAFKAFAREHDPNARAVGELLDSFGELPDEPETAIDTPPTIATESLTPRAAAGLLLDNFFSKDAPGFKSRTVHIAPDGSSRTILDFRQGELVRSNRALDIAIDGPGLLQVKDAETGKIYHTRCGRLAVNNEGRLCVDAGDVLYPLEPPVGAPIGTGVINSKGDVIQFGGVASSVHHDLKRVGTIALFRFEHPEHLKPIGATLFEETEASGPPVTATASGLPVKATFDGDDFPVIRPYMLERSNAARDGGELKKLIGFLNAQEHIHRGFYEE